MIHIAASFLFIVLLTATRPSFAGDDWRELRSERFTIYSQLSDGATRSWAREFQTFIESVTSILQLPRESLPPLTMVLFDSTRDFAPYKPPRPNGSRADNVVGFFKRTETWGVIGMAELADDTATRQTIFHEGVHWLLSGDRSEQPRWFSEGFAELFSTFGLKVTKVYWGNPIEWHILTLRQRGLLPMQDFVAQRGSLFDKDAHTGQYYAQSWALVHFLLLHKDTARREQLVRFLSLYRTRSADVAFREAFGGDYAKLQQELQAYVDLPRWSYMMTDKRSIDPSWTLGAAPPAAVQVALGRLALEATDGSLASRHLDAAQALAPNDPTVHELRTYIAMREEDPAASQGAAFAAIANGSRDPTMFLIAAESYRVPKAGVTDAPRRRVAMYENAINLAPRNLATYALLLDALQAVERPTDDDMKFLAVGQKVFPAEAQLSIGVAEMEWKRGRRDEARRQLDAVLSGTLDDADRGRATLVSERWLVDDLHQRVEKLSSERRFADAAREIASVRERVSPGPQRTYLAQLHGHLEIQDLLSQADAAGRANRRADARRLFQQVLTHPEATPELRGQIEKALKQLGGAR